MKKLAEILDIPLSTLYNWRKNKPKLFQYIENCYKNSENNINNEKTEIEKYFEKLTEKEKEMYLAEIKARVLRRELDQ